MCKARGAVPPYARPVTHEEAGKVEATEIVRRYQSSLMSDSDGLKVARSLLADDVDYHDPMMPIADADDLIAQLERLGPLDPEAATLLEITDRGDVVATLTSFALPTGAEVLFSQWFWIADGRIAKTRVIYDPRPFFEMPAGG